MRRGKSHQRGQGIVEFAVIFPIFAFLLFAVIDGGLLMGRYNNINNATKEGARLGATGGATGKAEIVDRVQKQVHGDLDNTAKHPLSTNCGDYAIPPANTNVICVQWINGPTGEAPGDLGSSVRVLVKYHYQFLTPIVNWIGGGWTVTACAVQRLERSFTRDLGLDPAPVAVSDCAGATGGTPSTPIPTPTPVITPTPTFTPTPVTPTATPTCATGPAGANCRNTQTAVAKTATAMAPTNTPTPVPPTSTPTITPTPCAAGNTVLLDPSANKNATFASPDLAYADGGGSAFAKDGDKNNQQFYDYGVTMPGGCRVTGVVVRADLWVALSGKTNSIDMELSWNSGGNWTPKKTLAAPSIFETTLTFGSSADAWGHTWAPGEESNLRVRITLHSNDGHQDFSLDWIPIQVYYGP